MKDTVFKIEFTPPSPLPRWNTKRKEKWASERSFYSCTAKFSYLDYVLNPSKTGVNNNVMLDEFTSNIESPDGDVYHPSEPPLKKPKVGGAMPLNPKPLDRSKARSIDEYISRGGSIGVFDLKGDLTAEKLKIHRDNAATTGSNIWHGWLSIDELTSKGVDYEAAKKLMRQTFGGFLKKAGFDPEKLSLVCALHTDKEHHRHIHFSFYEKSANYRDKNGNVSYRKFGCIPKQLLIDYRISAAAYLDANRDEFYTRRDRALASLKRLRCEPLPTKELYAEVLSLARALPKTGRLQYNAENITPFRKRIDNVAITLLRTDPKAWSEHTSVLQSIARKKADIQRLTGGDKASYISNLSAEYKSRLGNQVLGLIKKIRFDAKNYDKSARVGERVPTDRMRKAISRRLTAHGADVLNRFLTYIGNQSGAVHSDIDNALRRAEREIEQQQQQNS